MQGRNWIDVWFSRNKPIDIWINSSSPHHSTLSFQPTSQLLFMAKFLGRGICVYYLLFLSPPPLNTCQSGFCLSHTCYGSSEHVAKSSHRSHSVTSFSMRHSLPLAAGPGNPPGLLPFFPGCSFPVSFLGSSWVPQCLNIGNRPDLVLFLVWSLLHEFVWSHGCMYCLCAVDSKLIIPVPTCPLNSRLYIQVSVERFHVRSLIDNSHIKCLRLDLQTCFYSSLCYLGTWYLSLPQWLRKTLEVILVSLFLVNFKSNWSRNPWALSCYPCCHPGPRFHHLSPGLCSSLLMTTFFLAPWSHQSCKNASLQWLPITLRIE